MRAEVEIYGANNNYLTGVTGDTGADKAVSYDVVTPGNYYFRIRDYAGGSYATTYTLTVTQDEVPDEYEPNGDFAGAKEIALGTAVKPYIFGAGDHDWFKVNLTDRRLESSGDESSFALHASEHRTVRSEQQPSRRNNRQKDAEVLACGLSAFLFF